MTGTVDDFPRIGRWDSIGIDCSLCRNERTSGWPNADRPYCCGRYGISLWVEIGPNGYKDGEWFCRDFDGNGRESESAVHHLRNVRHSLEPHVLYGFVEGAVLREIPFPQLGRCDAGNTEMGER